MKGGIFLESLGRLSVVLIDKTGTLTEGRFELHDLLVLGGAPRAPVLSHILAVEHRTSHPMALALCDAVRAELGQAAAEAAIEATNGVELETLHGEGVCANFANGEGTVYIGNRRMVERLQPVFAAGAQAKADALKLSEWWEILGGTVGFFIGVSGAVEAMFRVADAPRAEALQAVAMLKAKNVRTVMCTGDNAGAAEAVRKQVGLGEGDVRAQLLPVDKVTAVHELKAQLKAAGDMSGTVAMLGDGVNDAPALAAADVGIAMGAAGTAVAMETADVVLMDSDLRKLVKAVCLGRQCVSVIKQNVTLSVVSKVLVVALTMAGYASLWAAIAADVGSMLLVTLNGTRVLGSPKKSAAKAAAAAKAEAEAEAE